MKQMFLKKKFRKWKEEFLEMIIPLMQWLVQMVKKKILRELMINTADEARALVQATRYAPLGSRSYGPVRAAALHDDYVGRAGELVQVFAMIETAEALRNRDQIMAVEGLSGVYVGPADLGLSLGHRPTLTPEADEVLRAIADVLASARKAGLLAGVHCGDGAMVRRMLAQGFDFASLATDTGILTRAVAAALAEARDPA